MPRKVTLITYEGKTQSVNAWAKELGIPIATLYGRLRAKNWSLEEILSTESLRKSKSARRVTWKGRTQSIYAWAAEIGLEYLTLRSRLLIHHWSVERALSTPPSCPVLVKWLRLETEELPPGIERGYKALHNNHTVGEVYKIRIRKWTHSLVLNHSAVHYSPYWTTRHEAVVDLLEKLGDKKNER